MKIKRMEILMTVYTDVEGVCHIQNLPHHQFSSEGTIDVSLMQTKTRPIAIQVPIDAVSAYHKVKELNKAKLHLDELCYNESL